MVRINIVKVESWAIIAENIFIASEIGKNNLGHEALVKIIEQLDITFKWEE
jgi:hypothetical protein